jgi:subtilase family serine protease
MICFLRTAIRTFIVSLAVLLLAWQPVNAGWLVNGHVPTAARELLPMGDLPAQDRLHLAIGLPGRDANGLDAFLAEISNPASPNFRHYLTPEQFTERFGPTQAEYQAVVNFAQANGLQVTATHPNRLIVDVSGSVADVQRTFHVRLRNFRHPTENRTFFAPENEPEIDVPLAITHIAGLTNYWIPRPQSRIRRLDLAEANATPRSGSGPDGTFRGNDFRTAYVPGLSLTGAGQVVGLLEFDGYNPNDILAYENAAGLSNVPLQNVMVNGYSGRAGSDNGEVCLDIQVAIAMAPGLAKVIVYEAPNSSPWEDILSTMANDNQAKQLSCSWGGGPPSSTAEQIFRQMAAQGQTFFNASGDDDAFTGSVPFPSDSPNVVQVGGTSLFTSFAGGFWSGEAVWNWGGGTGSGGGTSTFYSIPLWQQAVSMASNQGSTGFRNSPDVALTADNVYTISDNGIGSNSGGTSCAAPLWAGFTALVNELPARNSQGPVGYINPLIYSVGLGNNYSLLFHDITSGNNINNRSSGRFSAVQGFDLCTGWGTPTAGLVSALASPGTTITSYNVSTSAAPTNGGIAKGGGTFLAGSNVTVNATPNVGFGFTGWTENGNVVSTSASYSFPANVNRNLVANFQVTAATFTITLSVSPANTGDVIGAGTYLAGSRRIVNAGPKRKYSFTGWIENGVVVSTSAYYAFTIEGNRNLVAQFAARRAKRHRNR